MTGYIDVALWFFELMALIVAIVKNASCNKRKKANQKSRRTNRKKRKVKAIKVRKYKNNIKLKHFYFLRVPKKKGKKKILTIFKYLRLNIHSQNQTSELQGYYRDAYHDNNLLHCYQF